MNNTAGLCLVANFGINDAADPIAQLLLSACKVTAGWLAMEIGAGRHDSFAELLAQLLNDRVLTDSNGNVGVVASNPGGSQLAGWQ